MLSTPNNGKINVLWFRNKEKNRPVILYFHGNSGNLDGWGKLCYYFDNLGYDFIVYDFRGFGKSRGSSSEANFHSDASAVYDFASEHYSPQEIVLFGRSMGSGVASKLSSDVDARLLILETPYYSIKGLFKSYYPFLPTRLFIFKYTFPVFKWIEKAKMDVFIFQGTRDIVVPYRCAARLKPYLKDQEHFITIKNGKHSNLSQFDRYNAELKGILYS